MFKPELIGNNAGKLWHRLDKGELTDSTLQKIRKECRMDSTEFFLALGWLARENKVKFFNGKSKIYVFPNE